MSKYDDWKLSNGLEGEKIFCSCEECGGEIYIGDEYIELLSRTKLHAEGSCYEYYIENLLGPDRKVAE